MGVCYRPPYQDDEVDELFYKQLADVSKLSALVLVGDFNLPDIRWELNTAEKSLDEGIECLYHSKFADTELRRVTDIPEACAAISWDLDRLESSVERNLMGFNRGKCRVLYLGRNNPKYQYRLGADLLESSSVEKDQGVLLDDKLTVCPGGQEDNWYPQVHLEECGQHGRGGDPLLSPSEAIPGVLCPVLGSSVQERWRGTAKCPADAPKMICGLEHLCYEEKLKEIGLVI
ncbi:rna-directed dna polymerase from mobile element jockey-like [Pitangus sulphuratus]|nr:rna-directed dna polymerase from mobile element jockey-like [Pitangus sulphuratus]